MAGVALTTSLTLTAYDVYNNIKTDYTGTVTITSTDPLATKPGPYTFTTGIAGDNGIHTFAGSSFTLKTAGDRTFTFAHSLVSVTTAAIEVNPAAVSYLALEDEGDGSGIDIDETILKAGEELAAYPVTRDAFDNFIENVAANAWSVEGETGGVTDGDLTPAIDKKSAVFAGKLVGTGVIRVTLGAFVANADIEVVPGDLDSFTISAIGDPQVAGVGFGPVTVTAYDAKGNVKTDYQGGAGLAASSGEDPVLGAPFTFTDGVWEGNVTLTLAGDDIYLTVADGSVSEDSNWFDVNPGPFAALVLEHSLNNAIWQTDDIITAQVYRYLRIRLTDGWENPLADLDSTALNALVLKIAWDDDGVPGAALVSALPSYSGSTNSEGYITFGSYQFQAGTAYVNQQHVWTDLDSSGAVNGAEIDSNPLRITFSANEPT